MSEKIYKVKLSPDAALLRRAERFRKRDEYNRDHTRQREFEAKFLSRDMPDSKAARADFSDGGRQARQMYTFDLPENCHFENWYDEVIRYAMAIMPKDLWQYRKLLWNLYKYRGNSIEVKANTWPSQDPHSVKIRHKFSRGVRKILKFFSAPKTLIQMRVFRSKIK